MVNSDIPPAHNYLSFLLRVRLPSAGGPHGWRVSLKDLSTGKHVGFATWEGFLAYIESVISQGPSATGTGTASGDPEP